jgi:small conductance mechanosensitive channel
VINYSKGWSRVVLDVEVDYREDVDRAMRVMLETAKRMREESRSDIIEEPVMLGVDKLGAAGVTLRLLAKTAANKQADIGRELRRRVKLAFDQEGIKTPSTAPQLILSPMAEERRRDGGTERQRDRGMEELGEGETKSS